MVARKDSQTIYVTRRKDLVCNYTVKANNSIMIIANGNITLILVKIRLILEL